MRLAKCLSVIGLVGILAVFAVAQADNDQLMKKGGRQCTNAVNVMEKALPIYHGHRVKAIEITKIAIDEIRIGLWYDEHHEGNGPTNNIQQRLNGIQNMNEPGGHYNQKQIDRSNKQMERAADILTKAQTNLQNAPKDYGGHRVNALKLIGMALNEIQLALSGSK